MKTPASGLTRSKFLFRKGWEGKGFSPSGRKKSKFKCLVPMHPHLNLDSSPSNFWCNQQSSYPKRGGKKGWHLPFPWLWNPTGSKLFEVLFREETVIASIVKRGGKCHYTRITVAVTSAEKANELAVSRRFSQPARNRNKRFMCQSLVARVGCSIPRGTRKGKELNFLTVFHQLWLLLSPVSLGFILSISL